MRTVAKRAKLLKGNCRGVQDVSPGCWSCRFKQGLTSQGFSLYPLIAKVKDVITLTLSLSLTLSHSLVIASSWHLFYWRGSNDSACLFLAAIGHLWHVWSGRTKKVSKEKNHQLAFFRNLLSLSSDFNFNLNGQMRWDEMDQFVNWKRFNRTFPPCGPSPSKLRQSQ